MTHRKEKIKKVINKLLYKYKFVVLNAETFEERFTFRLSRLNVMVTVGISGIILIFLTILLIAFTPLREYIPGYSSSRLKKQAVMLVYKVDSLENVINQNNQYFSSIQSILLGDSLSPVAEFSKEIDAQGISGPEEKQEFAAGEVELTPSRMDSILRREVEQNEKYNIFNPSVKRTPISLYPPVKGIISEHQNIEKHHFGIDISLEENSPVKATAEGIVVFAEWTLETGYVLILKHDFNLMSIYKHNLTLLKRQGDHVKRGEVIALTGNTGEYTTGPHLHFELWEDGQALDPEDFFDFD